MKEEEDHEDSLDSIQSQGANRQQHPPQVQEEGNAFMHKPFAFHPAGNVVVPNLGETADSKDEAFYETQLKIPTEHHKYEPIISDRKSATDKIKSYLVTRKRHTPKRAVTDLF